MKDQSAVLLFLVISTALLWILVLFLLTIKVREYLNSRTHLKASVMDQSGEWKDAYILSRQKEVQIGKSTPANLVAIDFSDSEYASLIENEHASFQKIGSLWYVMPKAENGMVGLKQKENPIVYKLRRGIPYRINSGDMVYISYEKILIQKISAGYGGGKHGADQM